MGNSKRRSTTALRLARSRHPSLTQRHANCRTSRLLLRKDYGLKRLLPVHSSRPCRRKADVIDGKFIPGGTQIGTSPFGIYHSKKVFGEDASLFLPERWLEADAARATKMSGVVDLVFSVGKYQCLGKPVALMELNKIFVEVSIRY